MLLEYGLEVSTTSFDQNGELVNTMLREDFTPLACPTAKGFQP